MFEVHIHGCGGQRVVTAAEMLARAAFREGRYAQAFPSFDSERVGAPVMSICRIDDHTLGTRDAAMEPAMEPDALIVLDAALLHEAEALAGLKHEGFILVDAVESFTELGLSELVKGFRRERMLALPASDLARAHTGRALATTALLGGFVALTGVTSLRAIERAIDERVDDMPSGAEGNIALARAAHWWVVDELWEMIGATPRVRRLGESASNGGGRDRARRAADPTARPEERDA